MLEVGPGLGVLTATSPTGSRTCTRSSSTARSSRASASGSRERDNVELLFGTRSPRPRRARAAADEARREPAVQRRDAARRREPRRHAERRALVRDGAARGRRPPLRGARARRRTAPSPCSSSSSPSGPGSTPSRATVFRPRPNVDSALVAFRRRDSPPGADYARVKRVVEAAFAHRRKTLAELARARRPRVARAGYGERWTPSACRRARAEALAPEQFVALTAALAMTRAGPREAQPRARRRPGGRRRPARGRDRAPAARPRGPDRARAGRRSRSSGFARRHPRPGRARSGSRPRRGVEPRWAARIDKRIPGRRRARRRQLGRGHRADARERDAVRAARLRGAPRPRRRARRRRPVLPQPRARSSAPATARSFARLELPQDFWVVARPARGEVASVRPPPSTPPSTTRRRAGLRGAPAPPCSRPSRRCGVHATSPTLPPNDLASSPLADELLARGAFRADVSGAGPAVYGLFMQRAAADRARSRRSGRLGRVWVTVPAWYG